VERWSHAWDKGTIRAQRDCICPSTAETAVLSLHGQMAARGRKGKCWEDEQLEGGRLEGAQESKHTKDD
jgi:hypothetical protein